MAFPDLTDYSNVGNTATIYNTTEACLVGDAPVCPKVSTMIKKPYLVWQLDDTTMQVNWQLSETRTSTIRWGTDTNYSMGSAQTTESGSGTWEHIHSYDITGLTPGVRYYFKVEELGDYSDSFLAVDTSETESHFFALGDTQGTPPKHINTMARRMLDVSVSGGQTILFHLGDWTDSDAESEWDSNFFNTDYYYLNRIKSSIPILGLCGNHDNTDSGVVYRKYWDYNYYNSCYYTFVCGPVRHIIMNMYSSYSTASLQYSWLQTVLSGSTSPWNIVWAHEPMFGDTGGHGSNITFRNTCGALFQNNGVDVVVGGHNHYYARATVSGVTHLTTGGAGESLYTITGSGTGLVTSVQTQHFLEFDVSNDSLHCVARKWDDYSIIDNFTLTKASFTNTYSTYFAGIDDYGIVADSDSLNFGRNPFGISFWFKADTGVATIQHLVGKINDFNSSTGGKGWCVYLNASGRICLKVSDTEDSNLTEYSVNTTDYRDGSWHHLVVSYDFSSNTASYFIDGVAQTDDVTSAFAGNFDSTHPFMIGMGWNKGAAKDLPFKGHIDEVSLHNAAINQSKATIMYNSGVPTNLSSDSTVIGWWRMGEDSTYPVITDASSNSNDLTLYNMSAGSIVTDVP